MDGIIYKITNKVNGKSYIGQTRYTLEFRWRQHLHKKDNTYFHNAIHKYGEENFKKEILEKCKVEDLNSKEIYYIAKYNTFKEGYNLTIGGDGNKRLLLDDKYDEICSLYLSGFSSNKISVLYGVDKASIVKILKQLNIKLRSNKLNINNQEFQELVADYKSGYSFKELGRRYNCEGSTIKDFLIRKGVDVESKYSILKDEESQIKMIRDYLDNKIKLSEIQSKYHISYATFKKVLSIHGIKQIRKDKHHYKLTSENCLNAMKMFNDGYSVQKIAKHFNVDKCTIYSLFKRYNFNYLTV